MEMKSKQMPSVTPYRILVVEDDMTFETIWSYIIEKADRKAKMDWATSVSEAESLIRNSVDSNTPYDLIIADIFVSGSKTGVDLWEEFHHQFREKVVLVSGAEQEKMMGVLRSHGDPIYLQKPIVIHEAIATVYELLHRQSA